MRILHAIHDFLPRHRAGSEIYALELCRELATRHHVTVLCAEYDPSRPHGHVAWRVHDGLPVVEVVNNWMCRSFEETYRPPIVADRISHVLRAVQPDVVHVHNLLNLTFDLPALARAQHVPVVATLHDYALVCPSGGQRFHRAESHRCDTIDTDRCVRCFRESPQFAQIAFGAVAAATQATPLLRRASAAAARRFPVLARRAVRAAQQTVVFSLTRRDIDARLEAARRVFGEIDLFGAPSPSIAAEFERLGVRPEKIRVADYGFSRMPRHARSGQAGPLRIGYVGTLVRHKGVHVLLDAVRGLPASTYEVKIFGNLNVFPEYVAALRGQAEGRPVQFLGEFDRDRIADVYAAIDVLVVPSLWPENSPLVIHEAFMAGVPVVGARIGGIMDLVQDGRSGRLFDPGSPAALTMVLRDLVERRDQLDAMSQSLPSVKSIAEDAGEWEAAYEQVVRQAAAGGAAV